MCKSALRAGSLDGGLVSFKELVICDVTLELNGAASISNTDGTVFL